MHIITNWSWNGIFYKLLNWIDMKLIIAMCNFRKHIRFKRNIFMKMYYNHENYIIRYAVGMLNFMRTNELALCGSSKLYEINTLIGCYK